MPRMTKLQGSLVAVVTPMREDGALDYDSFGKLIDWHIREGTDGIVVAAHANRPRSFRRSPE